VQFRKVAEARREPAKFGTGGWRVITLDEYGGWVVGDREAGWPPLPKGPRRANRDNLPQSQFRRITPSHPVGRSEQ
jgi:hypothetical protein